MWGLEPEVRNQGFGEAGSFWGPPGTPGPSPSLRGPQAPLPASGGPRPCSVFPDEDTASSLCPASRGALPGTKPTSPSPQDLSWHEDPPYPSVPSSFLDSQDAISKDSHSPRAAG